MNAAALLSIALTGFAVAFLHAAIPTHWLPFVLVARARAWGRRKALSVAMLAGIGHILLTTLLGAGIAWFGFKIEVQVGEFFPLIIAGLLGVIAVYYAWRQFSGRGVCHHHPPGGHHEASAACGREEGAHSHWHHELEEAPLAAEHRSDWAAIGGLFVMLTLSPCEGFLPVYLSAIPFGWSGFIVLSGILAVATLAGMALFTWLTLVGLERFELKAFERYESGLLAGVFAILGLLILLLEHSP